MLKGIDVILYEKSPSGSDPFGNLIYEEKKVTVENVLVAPSSSDDIIDSTNLYGKKAIYTIAIPKGDNHTWEDAIVEFFGKKWRAFGIPLEGIEDMVPTNWHKKVMVERYE